IAAGGSLLAFSQALDEADGCANVVELGAELVFEEALITEVQWLFLVGKDKESGRRNFCLGHVVDADGASLWRSTPLEVDFILEPIVEDRGGDATAARFPALIDERKKLVRALASLRGKKDDRRIAQKFQFGADHFFVVKHQTARIGVFRFVAFAGSALGFAFRRGRIA